MPPPAPDQQDGDGKQAEGDDHAVEQGGARVGDEEAVSGDECGRDPGRALAAKDRPGQPSDDCEVAQAKEQGREPPAHWPVADHSHERGNDQLAQRGMVIIGIMVRQVSARGLDVVDFVPLEDLWIVEPMGAQQNADHQQGEQHGEERGIFPHGAGEIPKRAP